MSLAGGFHFLLMVGGWWFSFCDPKSPGAPGMAHLVL